VASADAAGVLFARSYTGGGFAAREERLVMRVSAKRPFARQRNVYADMGLKREGIPSTPRGERRCGDVRLNSRRPGILGILDNSLKREMAHS
jgi:hypothetical protein